MASGQERPGLGKSGGEAHPCIAMIPASIRCGSHAYDRLVQLGVSGRAVEACVRSAPLRVHRNGHTGGVRSIPMPTEPPRAVTMRLPSWMWGGAVPQLLRTAKLVAMTSTLQDGVVEATVTTGERHDRSRRPGLTKVIDIINGNGNPRPGALTETERAMQFLAVTQSPEVAVQLQRMAERIAPAGQADLITPMINYFLAQVQLASSDDVLTRIEECRDALEGVQISENGGRAFPSVSAQVVQRDLALVHRTRLPSILVRMDHDDRLRAADLSQVTAAMANGEIAFASSTGLGDGVVLFDAYLSPMYGAMSPFVWALPATRASGTVIFTLGRAMSGTFPAALVPLDLLPGRSPNQGLDAPKLKPRAGPATVEWWVKRLDSFMGVLSDPAVFADASGKYIPMKHLHAILTVEQLFRRTASIQQLYRDAEARRVLCFTVLDTLDRLTGRRLTDMCDLSRAETALTKLRKDVPNDVASVLLPAAERAVEALRELQDGFFLTRQTGATTITYTETDGSTKVLTLSEATAEYVRLLRNATHGHGSNRVDRKSSTNALLAHHSGVIPHDLPLLAYLWLLELLTRPDTLRRNLYNNGAV
jgi:hypothetical protein